LKFATNGYLHEMRRIKKRVLRKVNSVMFNDYIENYFELDSSFKNKTKDRLIAIIKLLGKTGKLEIGELLGDIRLKLLYQNKKKRTIIRDFNKLNNLKFITSSFDKDDKMFLEINYGLLDRVTYK